MALGTQDLHAILEALQRMTECCRGATALADAVVGDRPALAAAEGTTLTVYVDDCLLARVVVPRGGPAQDGAHLERQTLARLMLASLYRLACGIDAAHAGVAPAPVAALTPREHEVLGWVAAGKTNRDIADILGASPRTVAKHLEHAYAKLGVETRTAAAMRLVA